MNPLRIAKTAIHIVVSVGTGRIIRAVIKNNTEPESTTDKITYTAGSIALGSLVAAETSKYTDAQVDELAAWWDKTFKKTPTETPSE